MISDYIAILDYGSQYTQLIARRIREQKVYCEIHPPNIELNAMFNKKENKVELICKVNDDVSVKNVELNLNDLAKNYSTNYALSLMSGNLQNGIWSCSIGLNKKTNKADFYIMAQDSKNQESKTEIYKITSFIEK